MYNPAIHLDIIRLLPVDSFIFAKSNLNNLKTPPYDEIR